MTFGEGIGEYGIEVGVTEMGFGGYRRGFVQFFEG
jgi:hypothetical protein